MILQLHLLIVLYVTAQSALGLALALAFTSTKMRTPKLANAVTAAKGAFMA